MGLCNEKSDVWSMGCIVHEMCTLKTPFRVENDSKNQITDWKYVILLTSYVFLQSLTHFTLFRLDLGAFQRFIPATCSPFYDLF